MMGWRYARRLDAANIAVSSLPYQSSPAVKQHHDKGKLAQASEDNFLRRLVTPPTSTAAAPSTIISSSLDGATTIVPVVLERVRKASIYADEVMGFFSASAFEIAIHFECNNLHGPLSHFSKRRQTCEERQSIHK